MYISSTLPYQFLLPYFVTFPLLNFLPDTNLYSCCFFSLNSSAIDSTFASLNKFFLIKYTSVAASCHVGLKLLSAQSSLIKGRHVSSTALLVKCSCSSSSCLFLLILCSISILSIDGEFMTIPSAVAA